MAVAAVLIIEYSSTDAKTVASTCISSVYMKSNVKYEGHAHPLTVEEEIDSRFFNECQACGYHIDGIHVRCVQCKIRFHVQCGSQKPNLPQTIVNKHHHEHPLTFNTTEMLTIAESNYPLCAICSRKRKPWHPFYSYAECDEYSVHVRCVVTKKQFERDKLKHGSHSHYLIFNEKEVGDDDVIIICDICETSLQDPAYSCGTCKFSILKSCAVICSHSRKLNITLIIAVLVVINALVWLIYGFEFLQFEQDTSAKELGFMVSVVV